MNPSEERAAWRSLIWPADALEDLGETVRNMFRPAAYFTTPNYKWCYMRDFVLFLISMAGGHKAGEYILNPVTGMWAILALLFTYIGMMLFTQVLVPQRFYEVVRQRFVFTCPALAGVVLVSQLLTELLKAWIPTPWNALLVLAVALMPFFYGVLELRYSKR